MEKVGEDLTYHDLLSSEANLWSMLYLTGYLTRIREDRLPGPLPEGCFALGIPNREIREIFEATIGKWFQESAKKWDRKVFFRAVWNEDARKVTGKTFTMLFLRGYLPGQDMWWNQTESMGRDAATLLFRIIRETVSQYLR